MSDLATASVAPVRRYTVADTAALHAALDNLGQEYVEARRWPEYRRYLDACYEEFAEFTTAADLGRVLAEISFVTESYLVEDNWKAYREVFIARAADLGLGVADIATPAEATPLTASPVQLNLAAKVWAYSKIVELADGAPSSVPQLRTTAKRWASAALLKLGVQHRIGSEREAAEFAIEKLS